MVEFLDMAVGGMSCFPGYEDYHREYLEDYDIEYLEELVKKFSKQAKEIAKEQYSKENYYKKIMKIYDKVLKGVK